MPRFDKILIVVVLALLLALFVQTSYAAKIGDIERPTGNKVNAQTIVALAQYLASTGHNNQWMQGIGQLNEVELADRLREALGASLEPARRNK